MEYKGNPILMKDTIGYESDVFTPDDRYISILAMTHEPVFHLFHRSIATKELFLSVPERWTCLDQVDRLDARC